MQERNHLPHYTRLIKGRKLHLDWLSSVSVNDYPGARSLDWHEHDEMEVIFPVRGNYHYEFRDAQTVDVDSNSFVCIPPHVWHRLRDAIDAPGNRFSLHLRENVRGMRAGALTSAEYTHIYGRLLGLQGSRVNLSPTQKMAATNLWKLFGRHKADHADMDIPKARILVCQLLCECESPTEQAPAKSSAEIVAEAKRWLLRNASGSVNLGDLVSFVGYSRVRLFMLFKEHLGQTPGECLRGIRIEKAKGLLAESSQTISEISKACGLGDPPHFCRLFKKMTGLTPMSWRQLKNPISQAGETSRA